MTSARERDPTDPPACLDESLILNTSMSFDSADLGEFIRAQNLWSQENGGVLCGDAEVMRWKADNIQDKLRVENEQLKKDISQVEEAFKLLKDRYEKSKTSWEKGETILKENNQKLQKEKESLQQSYQQLKNAAQDKLRRANDELKRSNDETKRQTTTLQQKSEEIKKKGRRKFKTPGGNRPSNGRTKKKGSGKF